MLFRSGSGFVLYIRCCEETHRAAARNVYWLRGELKTKAVYRRVIAGTADLHLTHCKENYKSTSNFNVGEG